MSQSPRIDPYKIPVVRVCVNVYGEATSPQRALEHFGIKSINILFVRKDGWTLGCPSHLNAACRDMWEWEHIYHFTNPRFL